MGKSEMSKSLFRIVAAAGTFAVTPLYAQVANDYPTEARADYVFGCMAVNGQTREALTRCSCSVDVVASILPYEQYVEAETVLSIQRLRSERTAALRNAEGAKNAVVDLRLSLIHI